MRESEFIEAILKGEAERAGTLLHAEPDLAKARNSNGVSALMLARYSNLRALGGAMMALNPELDLFEAATYGDVARLKSLLENSPEMVNARSADGGTALHFACFFGQQLCAEELIARGADIRAVAAMFGSVEPLHSAAAGRSEAIVRMLLEAGAAPKARQNQGWTALHSAAQHGDVEMSQTLLRGGADPSARADNGKTALDLAKEGGHSQLVALLESAD